MIDIRTVALHATVAGAGCAAPVSTTPLATVTATPVATATPAPGAACIVLVGSPERYPLLR
jgi:hypothetical protein